MNQDKSEWIKHVDDIVNTSNNTEHSRIQVKPVEALNPAIKLRVSWHLLDSAKRDRKYPEIEEGSYVRITINQKKAEKGHDPTFTNRTI